MTRSDSSRAETMVAHEFCTTHWSVVLQAGKSHSPQSSAALEKLCRTYWYPLYAFVRRKGYKEEDAQDATQEFFARLLGKNDFAAVDPRKGKFRTYLLAAFCHLLANERDRARTVKRGGGQTVISLDELKPEQAYRLEPSNDLSPDKLFDLHWATTVLEQALSHLRAEMATAGRSDQFDQLKTYLSNDASPGEYAAVAGQLKMTNQAVAVAVHRLRQRYRELVRAEVAHTVSSPVEVEEEMRHLCSALNG